MGQRFICHFLIISTLLFQTACGPFKYKPVDARNVPSDPKERVKKNIEEIDIKVRCSKGTYIRTLVEDIGARLGVSSYTRSIRRIGVGTYTEDRMVSCDQILNGKLSSDKHIVDISEMLSHIKPITLGPDHEKLIKDGAVIDIELPNTKGDVVMKNTDNKIIGIGNVANNRIKPKRLINFQQ